jgi:inorganic triphosphatase YgiF
MHAETETELKLAVTPAAMRRLAAHRLLKGRTRAASSRLYSIYFDTPDFDLQRAGVALRLRRERGVWVQTVKGGGRAQAGLHQRTELEARVAGPFPDCGAIGAGEFGGLFAEPRVRAQLKPVFVTEFTRSRRLVDVAPGVAVEACLDRGEIRAGAKVESVSEIELELRAGSARHLFDYALRLLAVAPLSLEDRSKAERGYALARGIPPAPVKARPAALAQDMSVSEAFGEVAWATLTHLQANVRGMLESRDPEYLHQMRVAVRRLRSALSVFAPALPRSAVAPLAAELKWLTGALGPARDWDVFVYETLPPIRAAFARHHALEEFTRACLRRRRSACGKARAAVASARYQRLVLRLAGWLAARGWLEEADAAMREVQAGPVREFASAVLAARHARVRKRGRRLQKRSPAELHRLRIAVKKLRYAADFFAGLYDEAQVREALRRLARLQDILGAMNDAATVSGLMEQGFGQRPAAAVAEARGILLGWSRGRADTLRGELKTAWKAFVASGTFW